MSSSTGPPARGGDGWALECKSLIKKLPLETITCLQANLRDTFSQLRFFVDKTKTYQCSPKAKLKHKDLRMGRGLVGWRSRNCRQEREGGAVSMTRMYMLYKIVK